MDENEIEVETIEITPIKHTRWTLLVLGASWLAGVARETAETLQMVSIAAAQHNLHKREESKFYEIVKDIDG
ncbi:hypothetical protein [Streptomyces phage JXY1]|mgnify:CR=1 FL=1|uniref:Uncharacterized protein n=3 Tax=Caudoviricetes TaxID=2731619 RepID=A0A6C0RUH7_9CAUD|nr:hypothetical protein HWD10_gp63 [Streptomyces phage JXY1]QIA28814.1 hypothetical protein [Streptomyces phage JXY1]QNN98949.1 hypothetical protein SEA_ZEIGLE_6 [Streptomyces phage Zeigle]WNA15435.1 hypothetical protein SEA_KUMQUAT_6 [Streptomyces phage Kumquat]